MHPILFEIGSLPIRSYGVLLATAFLASIALGRRDAPRIGVAPDDMTDLGFWIILSAIVGARVFYVVFYSWDAFRTNPLVFFQVWNGGLVYYGGLLGAMTGSALFLRVRRLPLLGVMDLAAPAIAFGQGIGRLGCFLNGCCYGAVCTLPIGVTFPPPAPDHPVHPTQLYEAIAQFTWALLLWSVRTRVRRPGGMISLYLVSYAVTRFLLEYVRGDGNPVYGLGLTLSQWVSVLVVAGVGILWAVRGRSTAPTDT